MGWLTIAGLKEEIRKIEWPKRKQMVSDTITVLGFIGFFVVYFLITEFVITQFLRLLKVF
ncbi:MAG TPA: preprotein translocase subunit SecE [Erysipelothrix sp.]|nr:preprotein translocase subunit SecE [Erysipelothrix sp.]